MNNLIKPELNEDFAQNKEYLEYLEQLRVHFDDPSLYDGRDVYNTVPAICALDALVTFKQGLTDLKGKRICDFGVGAGFPCAALGLEGVITYGFEMDHKILQLSERKFREAEIQAPNVILMNYFSNDAIHMKFSDGATLADMDAFFIYPFDNSFQIGDILINLLSGDIKRGALFYHTLCPFIHDDVLNLEIAAAERIGFEAGIYNNTFVKTSPSIFTSEDRLSYTKQLFQYGHKRW